MAGPEVETLASLWRWAMVNITFGVLVMRLLLILSRLVARAIRLAAHAV